MAKTQAPLLSMGGTGSIGNSLVFATWKGVPYARRYVIPANPRTQAQQTTRTTFALLREMWKLAPAILKAPWDAFAQGRPFTGMNKLVGENIRVLRGEPDMENFIASPGARGGLPPESFEAAPGAAGEAELSLTAPVVPPGWTITSASFVIFPDGDPAGIFRGPLLAAEVLSPGPYEHTFTDLEAGDYIAAGWIVYQKPDGKAAYSVSLAEPVTVA